MWVSLKPHVTLTAQSNSIFGSYTEFCCCSMAVDTVWSETLVVIFGSTAVEVLCVEVLCIINRPCAHQSR